MSVGTLIIDGDTFTVSCEHGTRSIVRVNDPTVPETEELMTRYALQRHVDRCDRGCTVNLWDEWFEKRRLKYLAEGNARAHG